MPVPLNRKYPHLTGRLLALFEELDARIHLLGDHVQRIERRGFVNYSAPRSFLKVRPEENRLLLEIIDAAGRLVDPDFMARPSSRGDHFRDLHVELEASGQIEAVMSLVKQGYDFAHRKKRRRGDRSTILRCTFPFPGQEPPAEASGPCVACPNADRAVLDQHALMAQDDPALLEAVRSFASWLVASGEPIDEIVRYAADLYTRGNHSGACVPKAVLFAVYKLNQFSGYILIQHSEVAGRAFAREPVPCWPSGEMRALQRENLFHNYSRRYD